MAHVAPLGLGRKDLSAGYKHVAPLGLNAPIIPFSSRSEDPEYRDCHTSRALS